MILGPGMEIQRHEPELVAAAYTAAQGDKATALDVALELAEIVAVFAEIRAAVVFRGRLVGAGVVKADPARGNPGKASIELVNGQGETEAIETGWLSDPLARECGRRAHVGAGRMATFWKLNDPDPSGRKAQGFRRLVWIRVDPEEAT